MELDWFITCGLEIPSGLGGQQDLFDWGTPSVESFPSPPQIGVSSFCWTHSNFSYFCPLLLVIPGFFSPHPIGWLVAPHVCMCLCFILIIPTFVQRPWAHWESWVLCEHIRIFYWFVALASNCRLFPLRCCILPWQVGGLWYKFDSWLERLLRGRIIPVAFRTLKYLTPKSKVYLYICTFMAPNVRSLLISVFLVHGFIIEEIPVSLHRRMQPPVIWFFF